jgi:hypothetical protein
MCVFVSVCAAATDLGYCSMKLGDTAELKGMPVAETSAGSTDVEVSSANVVMRSNKQDDPAAGTVQSTSVFLPNTNDFILNVHVLLLQLLQSDKIRTLQCAMIKSIAVERRCSVPSRCFQSNDCCLYAFILLNDSR